MYRPHITVQQYRYHRDTVQRWRAAVPGDSQWATAESALKAFLPDTRAQQWRRQRLGWTVREDLDRYWLAAFLTAIRSGYTRQDGG